MKYFLLIIALTFCHCVLPKKNPVVLMTTLYNEQDSERVKEYIKCLDANLANKYIDRVHILYDTINDTQTNTIHDILLKKDITISYIEERPSYQQCFDLANELYPGAVIILSNADIFYDGTLLNLKKIDWFNTVVAITRKNYSDKDLVWYLEGQPNSKNYMSADTWIFKAPCQISGFDKLCLGTVQCDGLFAMKIFHDTSLRLVNLSCDINAYHVQKSEERRYEKVYPLTEREMPKIPWKRVADFLMSPHQISPKNLLIGSAK